MRWAAAWMIVLVTGCVGTRLVALDKLAVPLPQANQRGGWQGAVYALLDGYERAPVLAPEDEHLQPLFGGLTTLSYFGADAKARAVDQQIPAGTPVQGATLAQLCADDTPAAPIGMDLPTFRAVWIPLARHGGDAPAAVSCDEHGQPRGDGAEQSFCMFARAALQPSGSHNLVMVAHGLFDSGAQYYVQRTASVLYQQGHSLLLPDMRDHGETLHAAPNLATTLGTLEGADLLGLARAVREGCSARLTRVGIAGVSGGALAAIRAFTQDEANLLDAGVIAMSPLLDVATAIHDLSQAGACPATRAIELTWPDIALLTAAAGLVTFSGAALSRALEAEPLTGTTALAGGIGAGVGAALGLAADAWFDGSSEACVSQNAIAQMVQDALQLRWRSLRAMTGAECLSPVGRKLDASAVTLNDYMRERVQYLAKREQIALQSFESKQLANELRQKLQTPARSAARLLVLGSEDDPMTRISALRTFVEHTHGLPNVYTRAVRHGGHGALLLVQPTLVEAVYARFFETIE